MKGNHVPQQSPADRLLHIHSPEELSLAIASHRNLASYHLLLFCSFHQVRELLMELCVTSSIYSVLTLFESQDFKHAADQVDTVPFFYVNSVEEAQATVNRLVESPHSTVLDALNGHAVAVRYLEGTPS